MPVLEQYAEHFSEDSAMQAGMQAVAIDNILLATDFSEASQRAGAYAKALAKRFRSRLEIVNIFTPSVVTDYGEAAVTMTPAQMQEISDENLQCFSNNLHLEGIETRLLSAQDHNASDALLSIAENDDADLIVTGTQAKHGLSRLILGSTAERLLRRASCPVLTVGPKARTPKDGELEFKTIIYATDLSPQSAKVASLAVALAEECAARLYCCCVLNLNDEGLNTRAELRDDFIKGMKRLIPAHAYDWCTPEFVVKYGEASSAILGLAEQMDADLIMLGARQASFWLSRVEGGLTPALLAEAKCPILTMS